MKLLLNLFLAYLMLYPSINYAETLTPDLTTIVKGNEWVVYKRTPMVTENAQQIEVSFDEQPETGLAWLKKVDFSEGIIEVDLKGRDIKDKSYLGIAFHGVDEKTYEAIYFRPFNFQATDPVRKAHAVQYISEPQYPWESLRKQFPNKYENAISPAVNPNEYFHLKLVIEKTRIQAYINQATEPTLTVESLATQTKGWIGLWLGKNANGQFKNLVIQPKE